MIEQVRKEREKTYEITEHEKGLELIMYEYGVKKYSRVFFTRKPEKIQHYADAFMNGEDMCNV